MQIISATISAKNNVQSFQIWATWPNDGARQQAGTPRPPRPLRPPRRLKRVDRLSTETQLGVLWAARSRRRCRSHVGRGMLNKYLNTLSPAACRTGCRARGRTASPRLGFLRAGSSVFVQKTSRKKSDTFFKKANRCFRPRPQTAS